MGKWIKRIAKLTGLVGLVWFITEWQQKCIRQWKLRAEKNRAKYLLMDQWVNMKQEGKRMESFFLKNGYRKIAIYGMGEVGKRLVKELKGSEIEAAYGIDRNAGQICSRTEVLAMEDSLPCVDAVVITTVGEFDNIREALSDRLTCPVVSIEDIVNEL